MREFLTATDIEDLAARGVTRIPVGEGTVLTDLARDRAAQLGVTLEQGSAAGSTPSALDRALAVPSVALPRTTPQTLSLEPKPKGCLHGHIETGGTVSAGVVTPPSNGGSTPVSIVDRLVEVVQRLSKSPKPG